MTRGGAETAPAGGGAGERGEVGEPLLHHRELAGGEETSRWLYVFHGIYGAGRNWWTVARRLTRRRPEWGVSLVDLRMHGRSRGFEGPHTLEACAADLRRLWEKTGRPPDAMLGHSFGGKVVLQALADEPPSSTGVVAAPREAWVVDSVPGAVEPGGSAVRMLEAARDLPGPFDSRREAADALVGRGFPRPVARWMTTNLERTDDGFRWALDWSAMEELLADFFARDLWPVVAEPPAGWEVVFVKAEDSGVLSEDDCERVRSAGRETGRVELHRLPGGHWLNADSPDEVVDLLARELT